MNGSPLVVKCAGGDVMGLFDELHTVAEAFRANGFEAVPVRDRAEALEACLSAVKEGDRVGFGGSATLKEIGLHEALARTGAELITAPRELPREERYERLRAMLSADVYFSGANALTRDGVMVNEDGFGNRVSAQIFGPRKVVVVAGWNKITGTLEEAVYRVRNIAAPPNVRRLGTGAPCGELEYCVECAPEEGRICNALTVVRRVREKGRIRLVLVAERLGF